MGEVNAPDELVQARPLRALLIEDSEVDAGLLVRELKRSGYAPYWVRIYDENSLRDALAAEPWDIVLSDYSMPQFTGLDALRIVREHDNDIPFILISGTIGEELAVRAIHAGASDYLLKDRLVRLGAAIERAIRDAQERRAYRQAQADRDVLAQQRRLALDAAKMGWWHYDPETHVSTWDERYREIFGFSGYESPNEEILARLHPDDLPHVLAAVDAALDPVSPQPFSTEYRVNLPDGTVRWVEAHGTATFQGEADARRATDFVGTVLDISTRKRAEESLIESESRYRTLFDEATEGIGLADAETGEILDCNRALAEMTGYGRGELVGRHQGMLHPAQDLQEGLSHTFLQHRSGKRGAILSTRLLTKSGEVKLAEIKASLLNVGGRKVVQAFFRDVTEEMRHNHERETTVRLLHLLNGQSDIRELVHDLTDLLQEWTGCEAVGVRLQEGEDFPYFETHGFPAEFVEMENHLCTRDAHGEVIHDGKGNPLLECVCGKVLCGYFDPSRPYFTDRGSFWTNSITKLVQSLTDTERRIRTRNRCSDQGYESVALIPLAAGGKRLGLLQLNDHTEGRFTPDLIAFLENAADQFAIALAQRQAQNASRASEEHYRSLFANMINGFAYCKMLFDEQGRADDFVYLEVNNAFETQTGLKGVVGRKVSEVIPGICELDPGLIEVYGRVARTGVPERFERFVESMKMWFDISVYSPETGFFVAIFEVVTERKLAEEELRKLSMAVNQSPAAVMITDLKGNIEYVNPKFSEITGYSREEVLGHNPRMFKSGETSRPEYESLWKTITGGSEWRGLLHNKKKDGSIFLGQALISPIRDSNGNISHFLGIQEDITQQKSFEEQYRQAQKMEAIGQLAGGVAHDFNNMLQAIMGYSQMLLDTLPEQNKDREFIEEIDRAAERASALTRQLLAFSRRQVLQMQDLDLSKVVEDVAKMIKRVIGENIRLNVVPGQRMGTIHADCGQMEQVLLNLCVNARDAMPEGGSITIETENVSMDSDYCAAHAWATPGRYVLLSVTDTGCGMDAQTQGRIFEPFFTTKASGKGTGLGLSTVYGIVRQHQGMILVYSEKDRGTTFKVYLPSFERPASVVGTKVVGSAVGGTETILVAEDDDTLRKLVARILRDAGYTVLLAGDGEAALELFDEHAAEIDMCLLDVVMPKMGGKAVYDVLREKHPRLRFLFSSGYSVNAIHTDFVLKEGIELIQKPYAPDALLRKLRRILDGTNDAEHTN